MSNELTVANEMVTAISQAETTFYFSGKAETKAEKKALFNASTNPDKKLKDEINKEIKLVNVYIEPIEVTNEETGEVSNAPRIILFAEDGTTYSCVSVGVYNVLKRLFGTFGTPDEWDKPLTVVPKLIGKGDRNILTLNVK